MKRRCYGACFLLLFVLSARAQEALSEEFLEFLLASEEMEIPLDDQQTENETTFKEQHDIKEKGINDENVK